MPKELREAEMSLCRLPKFTAIIFSLKSFTSCSCYHFVDGYVSSAIWRRA